MTIPQSQRTKEIPMDPVHYPIRTCVHRNKKKNTKRIIKALSTGSLGQFTGFYVIEK